MKGYTIYVSIHASTNPNTFKSKQPQHIQVMRIRDTLSAEFSRLCYYGFWYAPEMELVMNSIDFSQRHVTGAVEIKLYKGNTIVMGRESPVALYRYFKYLHDILSHLFDIWTPGRSCTIDTNCMP
jgi:Arginosuccinate synthase